MKRKSNVGRNKDAMWIYGKHAVRAALLNSEREVLRLVVLQKAYLEEFFGIDPRAKPELVDKDFFFATFGKDATHQGCAALVKNLNEYAVEDLINDENDKRPFVFLDQVADPQNIGSILRAAAVFGARAVIVTEHNSPEVTPSIAKAASGALEVVPLIRVVNLVQVMNFLKQHGFWCVGLDESGKSNIHDEKLIGKFVIIIGSEGDGMRRLTKESCDFLIKLPSGGEFSTLNAAQAATVALYEILRQNGGKYV